MCFVFRTPSTVLPKQAMGLENVTNEYEIHRTVTTAPIVRILNRQGTETGPTSLRAPTYRKYVKRREKIETTRCLGTNTLVSAGHPKINAAGIQPRTLNTEPTMIGAHLMIN